MNGWRVTSGGLQVPDHDTIELVDKLELAGHGHGHCHPMSMPMPAASGSGPEALFGDARIYDFSADDTSPGGSGLQTSITDLSGNGHHLSQGTDWRRYTLGTDSLLNDQLSLSGGQYDYYAIGGDPSATASSTSWFWCYIGRNGDASTTSQLILGTTVLAIWLVGLNAGQMATSYYSTKYDFGAGTTPTGAFARIVEWDATANLSRLWAPSGLVGTAPYNNHFSATAGVYFAASSGASSCRSLTMGASTSVDAPLTDAWRTGYFDWAASKYGVTT